MDRAGTTLTTIGHGGLTPSGSSMQLSTVFYSVPGIGLFVAFNARLANFAFVSRRRDDEAAAEDDDAGSR